MEECWRSGVESKTEGKEELKAKEGKMGRSLIFLNGHTVANSPALRLSTLLPRAIRIWILGSRQPAAPLQSATAGTDLSRANGVPLQARCPPDWLIFVRNLECNAMHTASYCKSYAASLRDPPGDFAFVEPETEEFLVPERGSLSISN
jgi:hypothetical protein